MGKRQCVAWILGVSVFGVMCPSVSREAMAEEVVVLAGAKSQHERASCSVSIDAGQTGEPISKYIYGQFIEHLGRCIYGGIWAEMLEDRKFYYPITGDTSGGQGTEPGKEPSVEAGVLYRVLVASPWQIVGPAENVTMVTDHAYVGEHTPQIRVNGERAGLVQKELGLVKGRDYRGRVVMAGDAEAGPVTVSLIWGAGEEDRQTVTVERVCKGFAKVAFSFKAGDSTDNGQLEIVGRGTGVLQIGAVSLMPADNVKGFRRDTLALLQELGSPIYRWPGGNFVSGYNWKDGIGEMDKRPPRKNPAWTGVEHNDVGIDEFMVFCDLVKAEPYIAVNTGLGTVDQAREEVEYCNGGVDTPMGSWRARNGRKQPYGVTWWAVGNEMYGSWQLGHMSLEEYVAKHNEVAEAMRGVDASIKLVGVGAVGEWSEAMLTHCGGQMDLISEHFYCPENTDLFSHVRQVPGAVRGIADAHRKYRETIGSLAGKDVRIALDEWNYWYGPHIYGELGTRYHMKDALGIAAGLHEYYRNSDIIFMAHYAQTVNVIGCIKTSKTEAAFATTGLPLKLYRKEFGSIPVRVSGEAGRLDIAAAWTSDRKALTVGVVNPTMAGHEVAVDVQHARLGGKGRRWEIAHSDPMAYNEPGKPGQVVIREESLAKFENTIYVNPLSISLYRFDVE